jgi:hypothetical protein
VTCPNCGNDVATTDEFCNRCGRANLPGRPPGGQNDLLFILGGGALGFVLTIVNAVVSILALAVLSYAPRGVAPTRAAPYAPLILWICETVVVVILLAWLFLGELPRRWSSSTRLFLFGAAFVMLGGLALCDATALLPAIFSAVGRSHR